MEGVLLSALGGQHCSPQIVCPPMDPADIDSRALHLQINAIKCSTAKGYATGAHDCLNFCIMHHLPLNPTPQTLSRYITYSSQFIASAPKYLTGVQHFLHE